MTASPTYIVNPSYLYNASNWPPNDCSQLNSGDVAWMLVSTGLVLLMTVHCLTPLNCPALSPFGVCRDRADSL